MKTRQFTTSKEELARVCQGLAHYNAHCQDLVDAYASPPIKPAPPPRQEKTYRPIFILAFAVFTSLGLGALKIDYPAPGSTFWHEVLPDGRVIAAGLFKGSVPTVADLPKEGNRVGDEWHAEGHYWIWAGDKYGIAEWVDP